MRAARGTVQTMSELADTDPCSLEALLVAARRSYGEQRTAELRSQLERTAHACAALRRALDPRTEPAVMPLPERQR